MTDSGSSKVWVFYFIQVGLCGCRNKGPPKPQQLKYPKSRQLLRSKCSGPRLNISKHI